jgi:hypothetical protein
MVNLRSLLAAIVSAPIVAGCVATDPKSPRYEIDTARYAVRASTIPINRRYHELTAEQRAIINSWYEHVALGDEPPFPVDGLQPIHDAIGQAQAEALVKGEMLLLATVNAAGDVEEIKMYRSPSKSMTTFVSGVLVLTKFKPALCSGRPCRMEYPFTFTFSVH